MYSCIVKPTYTTLRWRRMNVIGSQITGHLVVCLTAYADPHKKKWKSALLALCEGNSPVIGEFPTQRASNAEKASILWSHHVMLVTTTGATGIILADQMNPLQRIHHYKIIPSSMESDSNNHLRPALLKIKCLFFTNLFRHIQKGHYY